MSETLRIFVEKTESKGPKGPVMVTYKAKEGGGGTAKAWPDAGFKDGEKYDVILEEKEGKYGTETWIKLPRTGGGKGGFGGGGRPDPARAENDRERLKLEREKHQDFLRKWDVDREAEAERQASIAAQVILKAAVELAIAEGKPDANVVRGYALDLATIHKDIHADVFAALASRSANGGRQ